MIRFLDVAKQRLVKEEERKHQQKAPYAIISHAWLESELTYDDMRKIEDANVSWPPQKTDSAEKLKGACQKTLDYFHGEVKYVWLDTVCIDKKNITELSASINSMYRWYKKAEVCFVYLSDVPREQASNFTQSKWFTRGWTLQELVAPKEVVFFDKGWNKIGDTKSLQAKLTDRTKIAGRYLLDSSTIGHASISHRMSWFTGRTTTVDEDTAYCLMGLFGVNMPLLYGEGKTRAFLRLQQEIMRYSDDHSLFAWERLIGEKSAGTDDHTSGLLAESPHWFQNTGAYEHHFDTKNANPYQMTNKGISIYLHLQKHKDDEYVASIDCRDGDAHFLGMYLRKVPEGAEGSQQYRRVKTQQLCNVRGTGRGKVTHIYVKAPQDV